MAPACPGGLEAVPAGFLSAAETFSVKASQAVAATTATKFNEYFITTLLEEFTLRV